MSTADVTSRIADPRFRANVAKIHVFQALTNLMLFLPVWIVFMQVEQGLSLTQVTVMLGISWLVTALAEVPTGVVADRFGRKTSLVAGTVLVAVGSALVALLHGYGVILVSYLVWSVGLALQSGADMALLYESLTLAGQQSDYERMAGRSFVIIQLAQAASSVLGGVLAMISLSLPMLATSALTALALGALVGLREPPLTESRRRSYLRTLADAVGLVRRRPGVRALMLFTAVLSAVPWVLIFVLFQPFLDTNHVPIGLFGLLFLVLRLAGVAGSRYGPRLITVDARPRWLTAAPAGYVAAFAVLLVPMPWWAAFPLMLGVGFLQGCVRPLLSTLLNERVDSAVRATVLSLQSLVFTLLIAVAQPAAGALVDRWRLPAAFLFLGVASLVALGLRLWWAFVDRQPAGATDAQGEQAAGEPARTTG